MEGMSERAYAEHAGLSRGAVQKARKTGRLVLYADGSINAAASDARRGSMTDPDQQIRSRGGLGAGGVSPMMAASPVHRQTRDRGLRSDRGHLPLPCHASETRRSASASSCSRT